MENLTSFFCVTFLRVKRYWIQGEAFQSILHRKQEQLVRVSHAYDR